MIRAVAILIIFGKIHFLLVSENYFFHEIKRDRRANFMDFTNRIGGPDAIHLEDLLRSV